ncbi:hypothetical protein ATOP_12160 [Granulimonas faecalis]|uniref:DUF1156 domain-containing protein n=1 Tax=Granulimonas faecalis TaxID=2894155 RepID=A0AAV5B429_9ACTN|nr:DUF1156 domain-containing protein [Granulimonas faecalis]GJM55561.1 hypothetical protein ATOP_12160 [Granulimonas faecalis]
MAESTPKKKLIEVALPLDEINAATAREKSIRHGHPSTLHLWWARRPLACARAVIWSSLVDDPSSHPEEFPTAEAQDAERERLFDILRRLVVWENSNDPKTLEDAKAEIRRSMGDDVPALLDPFAGGGAIPLEAQRLGLKAYAQDLNPVAVTINKAQIEIPPRFEGLPAMNPRDRKDRMVDVWEGHTGLAADVDYYGQWMRERAWEKIGHLYPKVELPAEQGGGMATVIAWLWARTVTCPNPACRHTTPLVRSWDLSKKKGKEWHAEPFYNEEGELDFVVKPGKATEKGMVDRKGAVCVHCGEPIKFDYIRQEAQEGHMGSSLMAVVAEGEHGRAYVAPSTVQAKAADLPVPKDAPESMLPEHALGFRVQTYGMLKWQDLFTPRQLTALTTFSGLVKDAQEQARLDAAASGMADDGVGLADGGTGATAYGEAVGVYLAFVVDQMANHGSSICGWNSPNTQLRSTFSRQAIPMTWDYAESNPFCSSSGSFENLFSRMIKSFSGLAVGDIEGHAQQGDACSDGSYRNIMVSTDPPYYDNIGYADLSDYFYVWLRQSLKSTYPKLFSTMLVPKAEELIATPYRHDGSAQAAKEFFESGMLDVCRRIRDYARDDVPVTIYYAFKQSDSQVGDAKDTTASTGWETMLSAIIEAGFAITGTWPMRSEKPGRTISNGTNALASSIVLVCRKRPENAAPLSRRDFVRRLRANLAPAVRDLQASNLAPVDMAQCAIGPGMAVFSAAGAVLESDGSKMGVRSALALINQELDAVLNDAGDATDTPSRFCVELYGSHGFDAAPYGEVDVLARAKNVELQKLVDAHMVEAARGKVRLLGRSELPERGVDLSNDWLLCQALVRDLEQGGIEGCSALAAQRTPVEAEDARALAYRLYNLADRKGWASEALLYNNLVTAWPQIAGQAEARRRYDEKTDQTTLGF